MVKQVSPVARWLIGASSLLCSAIAAAAPGDRDITFGTGGGLNFSIPGVAYTQAYHVFPQADGKLVAVGYAQTTPSTAPDFLVYRFNANGTIDSSFNSTGPTATPGYQRFEVSEQALAGDVAFGGVEQPADGKLVIVGEATPVGGSSRRLAVLRLLSNGNVDTAFGTGGKTILSGATLGYGVDAFIENDGSIVVAGSSSLIPSTATGVDLALAKFTSTGTPHVGFAANGLKTIDLGTQFDYALRALRQADGRYVVVGRAAVAGAQALQVARFNSDGSPDANFGVGGTGKLTEACVGPCQWNGVTQQPDGKLILSGFAFTPGVGTPLLQQEESLVARLTTNGTTDTTFGPGGSGRITGLFRTNAPTTIPSGDEAIETVVDPTTNQILILGSMVSRIYNTPGQSITSVSAYVGTTVARISAAGVLDTSYGNAGVSFVTAGTQPVAAGTNVNIPQTLLRLSDGRLIVSQTSGAYTNGIATSQASSLSRLISTGSDPGTFAATYPALVSESIGNAVVRVFRQSGASGVVSVNYSTIPNTALAGSDYTTTTGTLSWADGDYSMRFIPIPILADSTVETSDESFLFTLSAPTGGAEVLVSGSISVGIARDDNASTTPTVTLSQAPVSVAENTGSVTLTVTRTGTTALSVNYYTVPVSATFGSDFTRTSGVLVWGTGDTAAKTITIPIANDAISESAESFNVVLATPGGTSIVGGQTATVTITDDDPLQVSVAAASVTATEAQTSVTINVTRTGAASQNFSVNYATANGTATAGSDYTATSGTLTWLPTDADTKSITIPLLGDTAVEGSESFTFTLSGPTAGATLGTAVTTITITDDDLAAPAPSGGGGGGGGSLTGSWLLILAALTSLTAQRRPRVRKVHG